MSHACHSKHDLTCSCSTLWSLWNAVRSYLPLINLTLNLKTFFFLHNVHKYVLNRMTSSTFILEWRRKMEDAASKAISLAFLWLSSSSEFSIVSHAWAHCRSVFLEMNACECTCASVQWLMCVCTLQRENDTDEVNGTTGLLELFSLGIMEGLCKWLITLIHAPGHWTWAWQRVGFDDICFNRWGTCNEGIWAQWQKKEDL